MLLRILFRGSSPLSRTKAKTPWKHNPGCFYCFIMDFWRFLNYIRFKNVSQNSILNCVKHF